MQHEQVTSCGHAEGLSERRSESLQIKHWEKFHVFMFNLANVSIRRKLVQSKNIISSSFFLKMYILKLEMTDSIFFLYWLITCVDRFNRVLNRDSLRSREAHALLLPLFAVHCCSDWVIFV